MTTRARRTFVSRSEAETLELGRRLAAQLRPGDVVGLVGDLGAGKTRLVRGLCEGLGVSPDMAHSPTYVLANVYEAAGGRRLVHIDAYRLRAGDDLESLGWDRLNDGASIVVVEWADRVKEALEDLPNCWRAALEHASDTARRITIEAPAGRALPDDDLLKPRSAATVAKDRCRSCGTLFPADAPTAPFCSDRCRLADLGKWFSGEYRISRDIKESDLDAE